jgi:hypothetical protein
MCLTIQGLNIQIWLKAIDFLGHFNLLSLKYSLSFHSFEILFTEVYLYDNQLEFFHLIHYKFRY